MYRQLGVEKGSVTSIPFKAHSKNLPNIQASLAVVNLLKLILSGAIHLMGKRPLLDV